MADLHFVRGTVAVRSQRTRGEKGRVEQEPKTRAGRRTLSVPGSIMSILAQHLVQRGMSGRNPEALVFGSPEGEPLHYSNWRRRVWLPARDRAGLGDPTFHDVKHTAATLLVEEGIDVKTAQVRLGHADPRTTLRIYAQVTEPTDRAAAKIGQRLQREGPKERASKADPPS